MLNDAFMIYIQNAPGLLRPHNLQLSRYMCEIIGIRLWHEPPLLRLLHKILVSLFLGKSNGIFFGCKRHTMTLHKVATALPSHQWILPPVTFGQNVPVYQPLGLVGAALGGGFDRAVDSNDTGLKIGRSTGGYSGGDGARGLRAVEYAARDGGEGAEVAVSSYSAVLDVFQCVLGHTRCGSQWWQSSRDGALGDLLLKHLYERLPSRRPSQL